MTIYALKSSDGKAEDEEERGKGHQELNPKAVHDLWKIWDTGVGKPCDYLLNNTEIVIHDKRSLNRTDFSVSAVCGRHQLSHTPQFDKGNTWWKSNTTRRGCYFLDLHQTPQQ